MKKLAIVFTLLFAFAAIAQTPPPEPQPSEEKELAELLSIVQEETSVATKSRLNSDYVPGIVTVLEGDELEALGVRTAGEALGLVPGMQAQRDVRGGDNALVRGLDFPFNAGNIQVLVDSVALARQDGGMNTSALAIPVEQIERIEVIRGPGSVIYGDFAFMGLVNIITRKEGTRAVARVESPHPSRLAALRFAGQPSNVMLSANVADSASSNAAGPMPITNANDHRTFAMFNVETRGFSLSTESVHRNFIPRPGQGGVRFHETSWAAQAKYARELRPALRGEARAGYLTNDINDSASLIRGDMTKFAADLTWTGWRKHSLLAGADYSLSGIETAAHRSPPLRPGQPPGPLATLVTNGHRDILGLVVQDQIEVGEKLGLTVGARYDSYSDLSSRVTPRVAIVWRATEHHILKSQYAEGFRPPTFFEFYQQVAPGVVPRYPFEVNATTELNYVYRGSNRVGRVTLFRSELTDLIRPGGVTSGDATAKGFELEWSQQLVPSLKVMANASHNTTHDARSPALDHQNSVSARWMGNVAVLYHAQPNLLLSSRWNYVGDRAGGPGYDLFDFTISRTDLVAPGLSLRAGIKDAFNSRPTYLQQPPVGPVNTTTYPGRSAWIEVSWKR